jgi:hypothetical protein
MDQSERERALDCDYEVWFGQKSCGLGRGCGGRVMLYESVLEVSLNHKPM